MSETEIICIRKKNLNKFGYRDLEHWVEDENHIYIGRNMSFYVKGANKSKWFNPFSVKKYGRDKCLELYENHVKNNEDLMKEILELKGKTLGCWCKPEHCHGDILVKMLKEYGEEYGEEDIVEN